MALTKCRECGHEISTKAAACPKCGAGRKVSEGPSGCFIFVLLTIGFFVWYSAFVYEPPESEPISSDADCKRDIQCWGERHASSAAGRCKPQIERLAQYSHEWIDGIGAPMFARWGWRDAESGALAYMGDRLRLENGFGAWQNHIYVCYYQPQGQQVIKVTAAPGKYPATE